jgi:hypothetical protein
MFASGSSIGLYVSTGEQPAEGDEEEPDEDRPGRGNDTPPDET